MSENMFFEKDGAIGYRLSMKTVCETAKVLHQKMTQTDPSAPSVGAIATCLLGAGDFTMSPENIEQILELLSNEMDNDVDGAMFMMMENVLHQPMLDDEDE